MSKEEILRDKFNERRMANPLDGQVAPIIHSAMDEYAKQEAIGFAEWIGKKASLEEGSELVGLQYEQLYTIYQQTKH